MRKYRSELASRLSGQQLEERRLKERERKKLSRLNTSEETKARERERKRKARTSVNADETRAKERERKRYARFMKNSAKNNLNSDHSIPYNGHLESDGTEPVVSVDNMCYSLQTHHNHYQQNNINLGDQYELVVNHESLPHATYDCYHTSNNDSLDVADNTSKNDIVGE